MSIADGRRLACAAAIVPALPLSIVNLMDDITGDDHALLHYRCGMGADTQILSQLPHAVFCRDVFVADGACKAGVRMLASPRSCAMMNRITTRLSLNEMQGRRHLKADGRDCRMA